MFGLRALQLPQCARAFKQILMLNEAILIHPRIDSRKVARVFNAVVQNHESLRMRFAKRGGQWRAIVMDDHPSGLIVEECGDVDDVEFRRILRERSSVTFPLDAAVMFEMRLLRFGKRGDVILSMVSHMVCDGHSLVTLVEEFLKRLLLPIANITRGLTYEEFLQRYPPVSEKMQEKSNRYWRDLFFPVIKMPYYGRKAKNISPNVDYVDSQVINKISFSPGKEKSLRFLAMCKKAGVTPYAILTAAFTKSVMQTADCKELYCSTTVGRSDGYLDTYVGNFIFASHLRCEYNKNKSLIQYTKCIQEQMKSNLAHLPNYCGVPLYGLHEEIKALGGFLGQFATRMSTPEGRIKRSPFSAAFELGFGKISRMGLMSVERLDLEITPHSMSELTAAINIHKKNVDFEIHYEEKAYSASEISKLALMIADKLKIAPVQLEYPT